jgi:type II secretory pathway pseudopilin PulG
MRTMWEHRLGMPVAGQARGRRTAAGGRAGFTIVEVMVAVVVLVIAIVGIVGSMLSAMALNRVNRETAIAQQAVRRTMEQVSGVPFREAFALYNTDLGDDAGLSLLARGPNFVVDGLTTQDGDLDGFCGRIEFPVFDDGMGLVELREDVDDAGLGMPQDLDGDGLANAVVSDNYRQLPVRVLVEWRGVSGNRSIELESMLSQR